MGPLNLGSLFLHRCVQLLFVILEINNPCGSGSFRMAAVLHILGKRLLLFWINSQLSWRRCIRSVPFTFSAAAAKLLQSCPTLCDPIDSSLPGSSVPGILQARTLEWVAISFSNAWKWSHSVVSDSSRPHGLQPSRLLCPWDSPGKSAGVGCHCLLCYLL